MVRRAYAANTTAESTAATVAMEILIGRRKATRPAKNKKSDVCRSRGMISTTVCILKRFSP
jgi:hypothetical protein